MLHVPQHNSLLLFYLLVLNNALCVDTLFLPACLYHTNYLLHYALLELTDSDLYLVSLLLWNLRAH